MQIYFDFSGYSLMAIGLGWCLGFRFPDNFNRPFLSLSIQEFWRRWHMTLSRWLRDYLYIPLGGNRRGAVRTYVNLFLTMAIGGIWHGAGWTFLVWGAWHGLWLGIERAFPRLTRLPAAGPRTFLLVLIGWVFFRAKDMAQAGAVLRALFNPFHGLTTFNPTGIGAHGLSAVLCVLGVVYCFFIEKHVVYDLPELTWKTARERAAVGAVFVFALILNFSSFVIPFLYFQF
jgi:alginate O-acetyltransferase complex protein AlgI